MSRARLLRLVAAAGVTFASVLLWPANAHSYCVRTEFLALWTSMFPDLFVPVYISTGPQTSVINTGLTVKQVETLLIEVIRRHNESSVGPAFLYAGTTVSDMDYSAATAMQQFANRPFGITVDAYSCGVGPNEPCPANRYGCADDGGVVAKARVTLSPAGCNNGVGVGSHTLSNPDTAAVLLHEFGHALGLQHSNKPLIVCNPSNTKLFGGDPGGNDGVMHEILSGNFPAVREWRRDDVAGLLAIYPNALTAELAWWDDQSFPAAPGDLDLVSVVGQVATRPPSVSSAPDGGVDSIYMVTTDVANQVVLLVDSGTGFGVPETVENGPTGRSWGNPAVAAGRDEILVYWTTGERQEDATVTHRWGINNLQDQSWVYDEAPKATKVKRIAAGYAGVNVFVLSTLTDSYSLPVIMIVDAADGTLIERIELNGPAAFDIGSAACFGEPDTSYCAIPYSINSLDGVDLGWVNIEVPASGNVTILGPTNSAVRAQGRVGLASRPNVDVFRGVGGGQRYELAQLPGMGASNLPSPLMLPVVDALGWPVAMGSHAPPGDPTRWVGVTRREVECGNGIRQGLEECDDGNAIDGDECLNSCMNAVCGDGVVRSNFEECDDGNANAGDGCDVQCAIEDMDTESGTGGTGGQLPSDGCNCHSTRQNGTVPLALPWLVLASLARRRFGRAAARRVC